MASHVDSLPWHRCKRFLVRGLPCPFGRPPERLPDLPDDEGRPRRDPTQTPPAVPVGVPAPIPEVIKVLEAAAVFTGKEATTEVLRLVYKPAFRDLAGDVLWTEPDRVQGAESGPRMAEILIPAVTHIIERPPFGVRPLETARVPALTIPSGASYDMARAAEMLLSQGLARGVDAFSTRPIESTGLEEVAAFEQWQVWAPAVAAAATLTAVNAIGQEITRRIGANPKGRGVSGIRLLEVNHSRMGGLSRGGFGGFFYEAEKFTITPPRKEVQQVTNYLYSEELGTFI